ncbi:MAG: CotY/CotZ family spore coat protein [Bacilli bacterium]
MCDKPTSKCNCVAEILKIIVILQSEICPNDSCLETCGRPHFGPNASSDFNTRPVTIYTCDNVAWAMPISNTPGETNLSNIFRVEKLDNCCATFRVLLYNTDTCTYTATNSFFTMNTDCLCAIKCLGDTFVEGV